MKSIIRFFILFVISFLFLNIHANANGIPVIFAVSVIHIVVINFFVIAVEILLLKKFSKGEVFKRWITIANLSSLFLAYILTDSTVFPYYHNQWFGLQRKGFIPKHIFLTGVAVFIFFTILIEWVFVHMAQKEPTSWIKSLKYSAIINLITNIPIAAFYLLTDTYFDNDE